MAIDFPNSPTNGQLFTSGGKTWQYVAADSRWDLFIPADSGVLTTKGDLLTRTSSALTRLPAGSNGDLLVADSGATSGLRWQGQTNTGRNLLINGAMQVAQRGTSKTGLTGNSEGYYAVDRWFCEYNTTGTFTQDIQDDAPSGSGLRKSTRFLFTSADSSIAAGELVLFRQRLEGQDLQRFAKGTASAQQFTFSFWVKSNVTGTYVLELQDTDNSRGVSASYTVSASGTWEKKTITFPADTTGVFDNDNNVSLAINFWLMAGSNFSSGTLATTWGSLTSANRAVGQTNLASAINNYWQVTGVQLEVGPVATGFDFEPYETTLRKCERYFQKNTTLIEMANGGGTNNTWVSWQFRTAMRASPTVTNTGATTGSTTTIDRYFAYRSGGNTVQLAAGATAEIEL